MHEIINKIVQQNQSLFGTNPKIDKINIGFTNTIYNINDLYIVKICTDEDNEKEFKKEIDFYNSNKNNNLIPKLYCSSINKKDVPYFYEIIEKSTLLIDIVSFACIGGLLENIDLSSCDLFIIDTTIFTRRNENSIEKKFCKKIKKLGGKK